MVSWFIYLFKYFRYLIAYVILGNDYKKYFECIRRGSNIPPTIRRIYKLLDERKAYRRISDYFHRDRYKKFSISSKSKIKKKLFLV
jgi:hypothetical protein